MTDQQVDAARALADQIIRGPAVHALAGQNGEVRRQALRLVHEFVVRKNSSSLQHYSRALAVAEGLDTPWTRDDLIWALSLLLRKDPRRANSDAPFWVPGLIAVAVDPADLDGLEDQLSAVFAALHGTFWVGKDGLRRLARLYGTALGRFQQGVPADLSIAMRSARGDTSGLRPLLTDAGVQEVFRFAADLAKPAPAKAWLREADERLAAVPEARQAVGLLLGAYRGGADRVYDYVDVLLRGLVWLQSRVVGDESTALLCDVAAAFATPIRRGGGDLVAPKAAAAAVDVLAPRPGDAPVQMLARLSLTVRNRSLLSRVRTALERMGRERGWTPGEALELTVDDHGLDHTGRRAWSMGEGDEAVVATDSGRARLQAYRNGALLRAVPPEWKDAVAPARRLATEINKTLGVERLRVEGLFSQDRVWNWATWARRYLDHPITGVTARHLIWQVSPDGTTWISGLPERADTGWTLSDLDSVPGEDWRVRLWHPALAGAPEVARWRGHLLAAELRQPVKQAFREVYRLTPAEEQTHTYSNRFAAHILHYRQANALMRERGWATNYLGGWNDGYHGEAKKEFGGGEWQAVFFHDWVESSTSEQPYCTTDQVRFGRRDGRAWAITPLAEVPHLVFSEAMRDVDLFVGVTSIAADDDWQDRGEERFHDYRLRAAFAELTPSAEMRRDALARLLPRLTVGPRCELQERFLRVRGRLGSYRIHLGSANILMEPDDAYLCIVPDRAKAKKVVLPFDDDPVLSVILSKAIMLAADDKITDPTIAVQLRRSRL
ncbi:DUF4132 domain-containing protein [Actinoplanes sp. KI2]|uniref:DUF4132 domain-containing protein n=1 Tax=Actinoplanes sp. KI2 TaxID=2983315 RepID=UPI0021D59E4B|nr:DUF4132 domain-containing protein [Actinoplanes sp. KI2]MCU7728605.1 DUF4132 domain-containing protein [Actinoplanes sp. KI2]